MTSPRRGGVWLVDLGMAAKVRHHSAGQVKPFFADHAGDRELRLRISSIPVARADDLAWRLGRSLTTVRRETSAPAPLMKIV